jgi:hypothetical protein
VVDRIPVSLRSCSWFRASWSLIPVDQQSPCSMNTWLNGRRHAPNQTVALSDQITRASNHLHVNLVMLVHQ